MGLNMFEQIDKPTEPGYYWYLPSEEERRNYDDEIVFMDLRNWHSFSKKTLRCWFVGGDSGVNLDRIKGGKWLKIILPTKEDFEYKTLFRERLSE